MSHDVFVHLLPRLVEPERLTGSVAIVIDVLRASTTICHALQSGATDVRPVLSVDEAFSQRERDPLVVLGGERGGRRIDGFDLGNTPTDYTPDRVGGRSVVFTTTNGTRAMLHAARATSVLVGCFANLSAAARTADCHAGEVHVVCAGTDGEVTLEDCLCAGALVEALVLRPGDRRPGNDSARFAARLHASATSVLDVLQDSQGGRNLAELGLQVDVVTAAAVDTLEIVPVYDPTSGRTVVEG